MAQCALCQKEVSELCDSHIIPKLVYKRIRTRKNSRFRDLSNIKKPLQDGEKHKMLCEECEEKFSAWENKFAELFLDPFLKQHTLPKIDCNMGWLNEYCLSVAWRILHDDLYRMDSYFGESLRTIFEEFAEALRRHLLTPLSIQNFHSQFRNYIFKLSDIISPGYSYSIIEGALFGYSLFNATTQTFLVYSVYAGLVFVTTYTPNSNNYVAIGMPKFSWIFVLPKRQQIKKILQVEISQQTKEIATQYENGMTPELREKIVKFYKK